MVDVDRQKKELEVAKLAAEVEQLASGWTKAKDVGSAILVFVTLTGGAWGLYTTVNQFIQQQSEQHQFNVSREIIDLSRQLASENRIERGNAALLLANFGKHAVPILVENLRETDRPNLADDIIDALELVARGEDDSVATVLQPLIQETTTVVKELGGRSDPDEEVLFNYLNAIAIVGTLTDSGLAVDGLCGVLALAGAPESRFDRDLIATAIENARRKLNPGVAACSV